MGGLVPIFLMIFLLPLFIVPFLIAVFVVPLILMTFGSLSIAGTALLPFGMLGMGAMEHIVTWLADQDVQSVLEKTGLEDLESLVDLDSLEDLESLEETLTTLTPDLGDNSVVLTEVPRLLRW